MRAAFLASGRHPRLHPTAECSKCRREPARPGRWRLPHQPDTPSGAGPMTSSHPTPASCQWFARLAAALDRRSAPRLALLFLGAVLARGRRTVTSWIRAAKLGDQFRPCYTTVAAAGKEADGVADRLVTETIEPL